MKRLLLIAFFGFLSGIISMKGQALFSQDYRWETESPAQELKAYLLEHEGSWASSPESREGVSVFLSADAIEEGFVRVSIEAIEWTGLQVQFWFMLQGDTLMYHQASYRGNVLDWQRLDYVYLYPEEAGGETVFVYEYQELESQNFRRVVLHRAPVAPALGSQEALPMEFLPSAKERLHTLLASNNYIVYDTLGNWVDPQFLFGTTSVLDNLQSPSFLWAEKEACFSTEHEVVVIGERNPPGFGDVYAIVWENEQLTLFDTYFKDDGGLCLHKGEPVYYLVPVQEAIF